MGGPWPLNVFQELGGERGFDGRDDELRIVYVEFEALICFPNEISNMQLEKNMVVGGEAYAKYVDF